MQIKRAVLFSYAANILLLGVPTMSIADDTLRSNGSDWLSFGPAIINSCARIELHMYQGPAVAEKTIAFLRQDSKFNSIQSWIKGNFSKKLNLCPKEPSGLAQLAANYLVLYSSSTGGRDDRLLLIPLTSGTLGGQQEYHRKLAEIKALAVDTT